MKHKTTLHQYREFKKEFVKWAKRFGLHRIELYFCHENIQGGSALAWCNYDAGGQVATIGLAVDWDEMKPTIAEVKRSAFHECMEVFLFHARRIAEARHVTHDEIEEEWHRLIRTLETVVYDKGRIVAREATNAE